MEVLTSRWALAATAAVVASPQLRGMLRKGVVLGLAGAMKAGQSVYEAAQETAADAEATARSMGHAGDGASEGEERRPRKTAVRSTEATA